MGVVYRAEDPNIGRTVALKTQRLDVQGEESQELLRRLRLEARSAGILNHPNIVTIYDAGEQDALFYIAMEYIEGHTLQSMLKPGIPLPIDQVTEVVRQVCAGLDYAHARQIVHRDIKPANIMITPEGTAKIMDFGIAKTGSGMTSAGQVLGTPSYMSPEQVRGKALDGRSDLFSMGVILYETVTGQKPFTGDTITTIVYKIVNEEPMPAREVDLTVHPGLNQVITKALCKKLDERYQRGWDLARDLMNYKSLATTLPAAQDSDKTVALSTAQIRQQAALVEKKIAAVAAASPSQAASAPAPAVDPATASSAAAAPAPVTPAPVASRKPAEASAGMPASTKFLLAVVGVLLAIVGMQSRTMWRARQQQQEAQSVTSAPAAVTPNSANTPATGASSPDTSGSNTAPTTNAKPADSAPTADKKGEKPSAAKSAAKKEPATVSESPTAPTPLITVNGQLRLVSTPAGAEVKVDGKPQGTTPVTLPEMAPGAHTVVFAKAGYRNEMRNVEVERGKRAQVSAVLVSSTATLIVNSTPAGASVVVDGNDTGKLTPAQLPVTEGSHKVALKLQGWHTAESGNFTLKPGESYTFTPVLTRDAGKLGGLRKLFGGGNAADKAVVSITTQPAGATVLVNGTALAKTTPIARHPLDPGKYHVTVKLQGYKTVERDVTIEKGKVADLSVPLEKQ